jgi:hypothetical protein
LDWFAAAFTSWRVTARVVITGGSPWRPGSTMIPITFPRSGGPTSSPLLAEAQVVSATHSDCVCLHCPHIGQVLQHLALAPTETAMNFL